MVYTLLQLRQALAEEAFSGQFPIRLSTTAAGTSSALTFGALAYGASGATVNDFHGCWLYNTAAVPVAPFSSRVLQQAGFAPTTGVLTVAPAFGSAPGTAMEIIFCYDIHPDELHLAINRILRNLSYFAYLPVTLVADGDMEDAGVTNWAVVAGGVRAKDPNNPFLFGRQVLNVTGASGDGVTCNAIPVVDGEPLLVSVPIRVRSGTVQVQLWDATAAAAIHAVTTLNEEAPVTVQFTADAPSNCERVQVRFLASSAGSNIDVGPVTVLSQNRRRYSLDGESVEHAADIKDLWRAPMKHNAVVPESYLSFTDEFKDESFLTEEDVRAGTGIDTLTSNAGAPIHIVLARTPDEPYFMRVQRRFPELLVTAAAINAATNTTLADRDTIVQGAMHYIERARYGRMVGSDPQLAAVHLGRSREYARKFAMMRQAQGYGIVAREVTPARTTVAMS